MPIGTEAEALAVFITPEFLQAWGTWKRQDARLAEAMKGRDTLAREAQIEAVKKDTALLEVQKLSAILERLQAEEKAGELRRTIGDKQPAVRNCQRPNCGFPFTPQRDGRKPGPRQKVCNDDFGKPECVAEHRRLKDSQRKARQEGKKRQKLALVSTRNGQDV